MTEMTYIIMLLRRTARERLFSSGASCLTICGRPKPDLFQSCVVCRLQAPRSKGRQHAAHHIRIFSRLIIDRGKAQIATFIGGTLFTDRYMNNEVIGRKCWVDAASLHFCMLFFVCVCVCAAQTSERGRLFCWVKHCVSLSRFLAMAHLAGYAVGGGAPSISCPASGNRQHARPDDTAEMSRS